ncbi:MAG: DUF3999 family protein [Bryobacteraceae bacterium]
MTRLALSLAFTAAALHGQFDAAKWQFRNPVQLQERDSMAAIQIDRTIYSRTREDLGDIRLVSNGQEYPYVIRTMRGSLAQTELNPTILNQSVRPGEGVQFTADLGRQGRHSRLGIVTVERNFRQRVRIETSDDNRSWLISREHGYIFDFSQGDRRMSVLTVDYPVTNRRFLRATIFGWTKVQAVSSASVSMREERPAERDVIETSAPERSEDPKTQSSLLVIDLGVSGLPHSYIRIEAGPGDFHRAVELESSDKNGDFRPVTSGVLYQIGGSRSLSLDYSERHARYLRLRILNGDNLPVPVTRVFVEAVRRVIQFPPPPSNECWLYYGNPSARPPKYDLAQILDVRLPQRESTPSMGEWQNNPEYRPPVPPVKPWSERYPGLLYAILGVAVVGMGVTTVRFLLKVTRTPQ